MAGWTIQKLDRSHDREAFDCGNVVLNDWLHKRVSQFEKRDLSRAYVALRERELRVYGYYALSTHRVRYEALPAEQAKGLPHIDVPVVLLGRLAIDKNTRKHARAGARVASPHRCPASRRARRNPAWCARGRSRCHGRRSQTLLSEVWLHLFARRSQSPLPVHQGRTRAPATTDRRRPVARHRKFPREFVRGQRCHHFVSNSHRGIFSL